MVVVLFSNRDCAVNKVNLPSTARAADRNCESLCQFGNGKSKTKRGHDCSILEPKKLFAPGHLPIL